MSSSGSIAADTTASVTVTETLSAALKNPAGNGAQLSALGNVGVVATDTNGDTTTGVVNVHAKDDVPHAQDFSVTATKASINVVIILDISGSMQGTKLTLAKEALDNLLTSTDVNINQVMAVSFSTNASVHTVGGSAWTDAASAQTFIDGLVANGNTNYVAAINAVENNWSTGPTAADQTLVYFLSDGEPTSGEGLSGSDTTTWQNFLSNHAVNTSYGIGIGTGISTTALEPIAWTPTDPNFPPIVISDPSGLDSTLQSTLPVHNVALDGGANFGFGADGGYVKSITIDSITYNYDGAGHISVSGPSTNGTSIEVTTSKGGTFTFYFDAGSGHKAGDWIYLPPSPAPSVPESEHFTYTLIDRDGDVSNTGSLDIAIPVGPSVSNLAVSATSISFDIADADSSTLALTAPFAAAFGNPSLHTGSNSLSPTQQSSALSGTLQVTDGSNKIDVIGLYLGTGGNDTGVTAPLPSSPNAMYGFDGNDNLTGGSAGDFIFGGAGNDTINGAGGADTLVGGDGDDTIVGAQSDILLDGGAGTDTLQIGANFTSSSDAQIVNIENVTLTAGGLTLNLANQTEGFTINGSNTTITNGTKITGGSGNDTLTITTSNVSDTYTFGDGAHTDIGLANIETIKLQHSSTNDTETVILDSNFVSSGTITIDGSGIRRQQFKFGCKCLGDV